MDCTEAQKIISPYLDGELSAEEEAALKGHLDSCTVCYEDMTTTKETIDLLHTLSSREMQAPPGIKDEVLKGIQSQESKDEQRPAKRNWYLPALGAAAVLLVLFLGSGLLERAGSPVRMAQNESSPEVAEQGAAADQELPPEGEMESFELQELQPEPRAAQKQILQDTVKEEAASDEDKLNESLSMAKEKVISITGTPVDQLEVIKAEIQLIPQNELRPEDWQEFGAEVIARTDSQITLEIPEAKLDELLEGIGDLGEIKSEKQFVENLSEKLLKARARLLELEKSKEDISQSELDKQKTLVAELESQKGRAYVTINLE